MTNLTDEVVEKAAKAIRNASCQTPTYPWTVFDQHEAEANIREWCKYAAMSALSAVLPDVIAAERERAAKVAEELPVDGAGRWNMELEFAQAHADSIAAAIRGDD